MRSNIVLGEVAYNDVELAILKLPASAFCGCDSEKDASEVEGRGVHPLVLQPSRGFPANLWEHETIVFAGTGP